MFVIALIFSVVLSICTNLAFVSGEICRFEVVIQEFKHFVPGYFIGAGELDCFASSQIKSNSVLFGIISVGAYINTTIIGDSI